MDEDLFHINKEAIAYLTSVAEPVASICNPLFENFPVTACHYSRLLPGGRYLALSSNSELGEYIIKNGYQWRTSLFESELQNISAAKFHRILWPYPTDDALIKGATFLKLGSGITFARLKDNYIESYNFVSTSNSYQAQVFYINNLHILESFINYFQSKVACFLNEKGQYQFASSPTRINLDFHRNLSLEENIKNFLQQIQKYPYPKREHHSAFFSPQELKCLFYLSQGKTAKEIARFMHLSPRTIENYIDNIRMKTGYRRKVEIVKLFEDNFSKWL